MENATGKIIIREWSRRGPTGRKVTRTSYGYDLTVNGHRDRQYSAEWQTKPEAMEAMLARRRELEAGKIERPADRSLGQLAEEYLTYKEQHGKRSLREDRRILKKRLLPAFGTDLPVRRLTGAAIAQYERGRAGQVSAFSLANELTVLRHMLRLGKRWGYMADVPEITLPKKPEGRLRYLEEAEIGKLLEACGKSRNPYLSAIVTLALNTGMRKGEILGLEWERVDLAADYGLSARLTLYRTKSGKPRGVPLNRAAIDALTALAKPEQRVGRIFTKRNDRAWGQIRTVFTTALTRACIKAFRFHDLRHTFASHFVMRGGSLRALQEILGHADYKMTLRYSHLSPAHLRADMDRLDGLTGNRISKMIRPADVTSLEGAAGTAHGRISE
jgi:integrase